MLAKVSCLRHVPGTNFGGGRLNGSIRPAQRPLANIHDRGRMISASTMPPSLRSTVIESLAQVDWSGSGGKRILVSIGS
jgi:hypothetical protein